MSKRLPGMGVAEVQLHVGNRYPQQSIPQRNGGVGECAGIDQDPLARPNGLMDPFPGPCIPARIIVACGPRKQAEPPHAYRPLSRHI